MPWYQRPLISTWVILGAWKRSEMAWLVLILLAIERELDKNYLFALL